MANAKLVHNMAKEGFGEGTNELYDRARPTYQYAPLSYMRKEIRGNAPFNVVEIGSGTGIFTRALLAHPEWSQSIKQIRAVEPSAGMRDVFQKTVADDRVSVVDGTFEDTGAEDGWADLVVIAQAFHWCPDYDKAAAEFARVLKPDGIVITIWNLEDREAAQWVAQLRDTYESHEQGTPQFRLNLWHATFSTPSYTANFLPPITDISSYTLPGTLDIVIDRICSKSYVAVLPEDKKSDVIKDVKIIIDRGDEMVWTDKEKGVFEYPYKTHVVVWKKK